MKLALVTIVKAYLNACDACSWHSLDGPYNVDCFCKSHRSAHDAEQLGSQDGETSMHQWRKLLSFLTS